MYLFSYLHLYLFQCLYLQKIKAFQLYFALGEAGEKLQKLGETLITSSPGENFPSCPVSRRKDGKVTASKKEEKDLHKTIKKFLHPPKKINKRFM